jgi:hypothetical protein
MNTTKFRTDLNANMATTGQPFVHEYKDELRLCAFYVIVV